MLLQIGELGRRMRTIEDMVSDLSTRVGTMNEHLIKKEKSHDSSVTGAIHIVNALKKEMDDLQNDVREMRRHLSHTALAAKVKEIDSYISMIDPTKFVTRDELDKMLKGKGID